MKKINLLVCMLLAFATHALANNLTQAQEKAQRELYAYLDKEGKTPEVDIDNSVCFRYNGVLYWINIEEESPLLFSFHRKGFRVGNEESDYKRTPAIVAANEVNCKHRAVKLSVEEKRVEVKMQVYVDKAEDFTAVFNEYLKCFNNVDTDFKEAYKLAAQAEKEKADAIDKMIRDQMPPSVLKDMVNNISFRLLNEESMEVTPYDQPLRSFKARYIQARIDFKNLDNKWEGKETEKEFKLQIKVTRPDGTPIYLKDKKYSAEGTIKLPKKKKGEHSFELKEFGSPKEGFWKAGEYKVELMESGDVIYTTSFNIL